MRIMRAIIAVSVLLVFAVIKLDLAFSHEEEMSEKMAATESAIHKIPGTHKAIIGLHETEIDEELMSVLAQEITKCIDQTLIG